MSKAILIMDMPENCAECDICSNDGICMKANEFCSNRYETKQDWCPLKLLQEKKDPNKALTWEHKKWLDGYNACIDELLKVKDYGDLKQRLKSKIVDMEARLLFVESKYAESLIGLLTECYSFICQTEGKENDLKLKGGAE